MSLSAEPAAGNIGACEPSRAQRLRRAIKAPGPIETVVESVRAILAAELDARLAAVAAEDDGGYEDDMIVTSSPAEHLRAEHARLVSALQAAIVPPWPVRPAYAGDLPEWQRLRLIEALGLLRRRGGRRLHVLGYTLGGYEFWRRLPRLDGAAVTTCGEKVKVDGEQVRVVRLPEWVRQREAREKRTRKRQQTASNRCSEHERAKQCVALPAQPMAERSGDRQAGGTGVRGASSAQHEGAETGAGERVDQSPAASSDASSELRPLMFATADTDACEPEYEVSDEVEVTLPVRLLAHRDEIGDHGLYVLHLLHRNRRASDEDTEGRAQELRDGWRPLSTKILERILGTVRVDAGVQHNSKEGQALARRWPNVHLWMLAQKVKGTSTLPCDCQQREAAVWIDTIAPRLAALKLPCLTVHDSVLVPRSRAAEARAVVEQVYAEKGLRAKFKGGAGKCKKMRSPLPALVTVAPVGCHGPDPRELTCRNYSLSASAPIIKQNGRCDTLGAARAASW